MYFFIKNESYPFKHIVKYLVTAPIEVGGLDKSF